MRCLMLLLLSSISIASQSQTTIPQLKQTIRGMIVDIDNELPMLGASITILDYTPLIGTTTDLEGEFKLENVPLGRITLEVGYLGYETKIIPNIIVNSGKEVVLQIALEESVITLDKVTVTAYKNKGEAINEMAVLSARSVSAEETDRYAGGFNDPSKILSNFAGVTSSHDGGNEIIIRGNSPKYVQWRLEGIQITNPNHFGDQSAAGGAISTLNNNLLAASDFYTGAFSPEFGDVLSGVYDVKLRNGNNEKSEKVFGFGLLGTDITLEGPISKNYGGSYLINYRYSTASIINSLGLLGEIDGIPKFQDAAFKLRLPTQKFGTFNIFGLGGKSSVLFNDVTPALWDVPGDLANNQQEAFDKNAHLINLGINHTYSFNGSSFLKTSLAFANEKVADEVIVSDVIRTYDGKELFLKDSVTNTYSDYQGTLKKNNFRAAITYNYKISPKHKIKIGSKYLLSNMNNDQSQLQLSGERESLVNFDENIGTLRNFISWKYRANEKLTIVSGLHNMNVLLNSEHTLEPRLAIAYKMSPTLSLSAGYGLHSNMESIHNYFAQVPDGSGRYSEPNKDLGLLKAHHYILGVEKRVGKNMRAKLEGYYQDQYNIPVENNSSSHYSTINEGLEFNYVPLVNEGKGKNYGIEFTLEKFYDNHFYYLINASLYESKYTALDGIERDTRYNGKYLINLLGGYEFTNLGKKNNQTLNLNAKVFYGGGKKILSLLRDGQGNLAIDPSQNLYWDYANAYENKLEDIHLIVLSASYKWNRKKTTHEIYLTLDNLTNTKGKISEFYDEREPNDVGYMQQLGFFPNLLYRVYF